MKYYFAADIGGTKTAIGLYDETFREHMYTVLPTKPEEGLDALIERIYRSKQICFEAYPIAAACVACPGPLNRKDGTVDNRTTLRWQEPIVEKFERKFGCSFVLVNDCSAGALGESMLRRANDLIYVSVSTGIGGGIVVGGKLFEGRGNAAEFGHLCVGGKDLPCGCGKNNCLELYASGRALERLYLERTGKIYDCPHIMLFAQEGDACALTLVKSASEFIAYALSQIESVLDIGAIVIGGGVCRSAFFRAELSAACNALGFSVLFSERDGKQVLIGAVRYIMLHS